MTHQLSPAARALSSASPLDAWRQAAREADSPAEWRVGDELRGPGSVVGWVREQGRTAVLIERADGARSRRMSLAWVSHHDAAREWRRPDGPVALACAGGVVSTLLDTLAQIRACEDARIWVASQEGTAYAMWRRCDRGDWILCLAARAGVDRRLVVLAACDCAETALVHVPVGEDRPRLAIETARRWTTGEATIAEVRAAARAACAATAAYFSTAYSAAYSAAYFATTAAATAAYFATTCSVYDANATVNATAAAKAADAHFATAAAAYAASLAHSARLVRARIPWSVVRDALAGVASREVIATDDEDANPR